jgi:hypothetical protein
MGKEFSNCDKTVTGSTNSLEHSTISNNEESIMRKYGLYLLAVLMAGALAACGSGGGGHHHNGNGDSGNSASGNGSGGSGDNGGSGSGGGDSGQGGNTGGNGGQTTTSANSIVNSLVMQYFPKADQIAFDDSNETILQDTANYSFLNIDQQTADTYFGTLEKLGFSQNDSKTGYFAGTFNGSKYGIPSTLKGVVNGIESWGAGAIYSSSQSMLSYDYVNGDSSPDGYNAISFSSVMGDVPTSDDYSILQFTRVYQSSDTDSLTSSLWNYEQTLSSSAGGFYCASQQWFKDHPGAVVSDGSTSDVTDKDWECQKRVEATDSLSATLYAAEYKIDATTQRATLELWTSKP